jgi:xanthine dehydrogenase YagR molybdenum-binding subunit
MSNELENDSSAELNADEAALLDEMPVNADIHAIETIFVEEHDAVVSRVKGMGKPAWWAYLRAWPMPSSIRDLPITPEKLL